MSVVYSGARLQRTSPMGSSCDSSGQVAHITNDLPPTAQVQTPYTHCSNDNNHSQDCPGLHGLTTIMLLCILAIRASHVLTVCMYVADSFYLPVHVRACFLTVLHALLIVCSSLNTDDSNGLSLRLKLQEVNLLFQLVKTIINSESSG